MGKLSEELVWDGNGSGDSRGGAENAEEKVMETAQDLPLARVPTLRGCAMPIHFLNVSLRALRVSV